MEQLRGSWRPESVTESGRKLTGADLEAYKGMSLTILEGKSTLKAVDGTVLSACELKLDAARDPKFFDAKEVEGLGVGRTYKGVWEVEGDTLKWCFSTKDRPNGVREQRGGGLLSVGPDATEAQVRPVRSQGGAPLTPRTVWRANEHRESS